MIPADKNAEDASTNASTPPRALMGLAFVTLGMLIGTLLAFSAQSLAQAVVAALFAFFGGSAVPLVSTKDRSGQATIAISTFGLALGALIGVYRSLHRSGIPTDPHLGTQG